MVDKHFGRKDAYLSRLIRRKAKALCRYLGLSSSHAEDFEQVLWVHLLERQHLFNPELATFETFADRIIENKVRSIIRYFKAQKRDIQREAFSVNDVLSFGDDDPVARHETISSGKDDVLDAMFIDEQVRVLMEALDPADQQILRLRLDGYPKVRIATMLGISRRKVDAAMVRICAVANELKILGDEDDDE